MSMMILKEMTSVWKEVSRKVFLGVMIEAYHNHCKSTFVYRFIMYAHRNSCFVAAGATTKSECINVRY